MAGLAAEWMDGWDERIKTIKCAQSAQESSNMTRIIKYARHVGKNTYYYLYLYDKLHKVTDAEFAKKKKGKKKEENSTQK